jgi:hypothetical protein
MSGITSSRRTLAADRPETGRLATVIQRFLENAKGKFGFFPVFF